MAIGLFVLAVIIQLAVVLAIFLLSLSRVTGSIVALVTVVVTAIISPWSLILGVPIALLCLVLLITPIRQALITKRVYKALGGAMGGYTTAKKEVIEILRQRSRPYLFSNSLAPSIVGASLKVFELLEKDTSLRDKLEWNTNYFKTGMKKAGFDIIEGDSAIVPVMLYDAKLSQIMADELLKKGIYVIGFFFPVVPKDKARIRVQLSAAHTKAHLDKAINAFIEVGKVLKVV